MDFFSKIFKNKRALFVILIFLIIGGVISPILSHASAPASGPTFSLQDSCSTLQGQQASTVPYDTAKHDFGSIYNTAIGVGNFLSMVITGVVKFFLYLFSVVSSVLLDKQITSGFAADVLNTVKNLANMAIVLGFVIVGIATALRIETYKATKLLLPLIAVAILINFAGLFVGLIIDASNIIAVGISEQGGQNPYDGVKNIGNIISCTMNNQLRAAWAQKNPGLILSYQGMGIAIWLVFILAIVVATATYLQRYSMLILLYIVSPLAFVAWIFPASKKLWTEWWNSFLKWCFIGVGLYFSFFLAAKTLAASTLFSDLTLRTFIAICFIIFGIRATAKKSGLAAMASSAVIGLATGGAGFALGAVGAGKLAGAMGKSGQRGASMGGKVGKQIADTTGLTKAGQWAKDKATSAGERLKLVSKGTTTANRAKRLEEPTKRLENITDNEQLAKIAEQSPITAQQSADKAAAAQILAKRNAWGAISASKQDAVAAHATAFGVDKGVFAKAAPTTGVTAATDKEAINYIHEKQAGADLRAGRFKTREQALKNARKSNPSPVAADIASAHQEIKQNRTIENALGLSSLSERNIRNKALEDYQKQLVTAGNTPPEINKLMNKYKPDDQTLAKAKEALSQERIQKGFAKLDVGGIRNLPKEALSSLDLLKNTGAQRLGRAGLEMSQDKINELKKGIPVMRSHIESDLGLASGATIAQINAAYGAASKDVQKKVREMADKINTIIGL